MAVVTANQNSLLTERWTPMRYHPVQQALMHSTARFKIVPAGRRSGKTELAKRNLVLKAMASTKPRARYFAGAPVYSQAKEIYWQDLIDLIPKWFMQCEPNKTDLCIKLINNAEIHIVGMDKAKRMEGPRWDGGVLDESGEMKPDVWEKTLRPALSEDPDCWAWLIGKPRGRNHYWKWWTRALEDTSGDWAGFTWKSSDILLPSEIEAAKRDLDELTYSQELDANFVTFEGQAYYPFNRADHTGKLEYDIRAPLIICLDFNVAPGVAAIAQEQDLPSGSYGTGIIGEVHIPRNSNTPAVCRKIAHDWGNHKGNVMMYGDATGGLPGSAKVQGSDWDLVKEELRPVFGDRLIFRVAAGNPRERNRLNAMNSRLKSKAGDIRLMVDGEAAPHVVQDFEGVSLLKGGSGEIDKKDDLALTHLTDAIGYYIEREYSISKFPDLSGGTVLSSGS